jgi:hypothetical protein
MNMVYKLGVAVWVAACVALLIFGWGHTFGQW